MEPSEQPVLKTGKYKEFEIPIETTLIPLSYLNLMKCVRVPNSQHSEIEIPFKASDIID